MYCSLPGSSVHGDSPGKNTGVGCHALLQGIFPTQGSNPGLWHCRKILYHLTHQGSPRILEWVAYPFSRGNLPDPRIEPGSPALQEDSLPDDLPGKPFDPTCLLSFYIIYIFLLFNFIYFNYINYILFVYLYNHFIIIICFNYIKF